MKTFIEYIKQLNENVVIPSENEEQQPLKSIKEIQPLIPILVSKAQNAYDNWEQDDQGYDHEYGAGGICHTIAEEIASVLNDHGIDATTVSATIGTQHVYTIAKFEEGVYEIDIHPSTYETGAAYTWKKIPNVKFDNDDIIIDKIDSDPESFNNYIE